MSPVALQEIVDALAVRLSRSVAIDDRAMHLLAVSRHFGDEDPSRVYAVLHREAAAENTSYVLSQGIARWSGPGRVPARPDLGAAARVCAPVRAHGLLLGYLWLIDERQTLTEADLAQAQEAADTAGLVLYRQLMHGDEERAGKSALVLDLVGDDPGRRETARRTVLARGTRPRPDYTLIVIADAHRGAAHHGVALDPVARQALPQTELELVLRTAADRATRSMPPGSSMTAVADGRATLLLTESRPIAQERAADVAQLLLDGLADLAMGDRAVVGIGGCHEGLGGALTSRRQAEDAIRVARLMPDLGRVVPWHRLGVYAFLLQLVPPEPADWVYPEPFARLLASDPGGKLLTTLETYLDRAGDAQQAAAALQIHRTTLYYRLRRVEELAGLSLTDGGDRLTLHLGLKLARLAGGLPDQQPT